MDVEKKIQEARRRVEVASQFLEFAHRIETMVVHKKDSWITLEYFGATLVFPSPPGKLKEMHGDLDAAIAAFVTKYAAAFRQAASDEMDGEGDIVLLGTR